PALPRSASFPGWIVNRASRLAPRTSNGRIPSRMRLKRQACSFCNSDRLRPRAEAPHLDTRREPILAAQQGSDVWDGACSLGQACSNGCRLTPRRRSAIEPVEGAGQVCAGEAVLAGVELGQGGLVGVVEAQ